MSTYTAATKPTFYFIGVTTAKSSIMRVFPAWAKHLGLRDVLLKGVDLKLHDEVENYREVVNFIKNDANSLGALVTTRRGDLAAMPHRQEVDALISSRPPQPVLPAHYG